MFGRESCDPTAFFHYLRQPPAWGLSLSQHSTKAKERHPELHASHSKLRRDPRSTADELAPGRQRRHNHVSFEKAWHGQGIFWLLTQLKRIWNHPLSLEIAWAGRSAAAKELQTCGEAGSCILFSPRHCARLSRRKIHNLRKVTVTSMWGYPAGWLQLRRFCVFLQMNRDLLCPSSSEPRSEPLFLEIILHLFSFS